MVININGFEINYTDEGNGQPILFLHGWGSSLSVWNFIVNHLKQQNKYRLVALDFPGCGESSVPENPLQLEDYTSLVVEFCKHLNINEPTVFGHSHGGRVTLALAGNKMLNIKKAVLFGAAGLKPSKNIKTKIKVFTFKAVKFFLTLPIIKNYTQDTLNKARKHFGSSDYNNAPPVMRKTLVNLVNEDLTDILPKISCSVLLIWGSHDTAVPLYLAKKMEKLIPDAGLCVLDGCSHFAFIERPGDTNIIIDSFLN